MKDELIIVYSGRGMVVGCVGVGKIIFVKKFKGEKNLDIKLISGIEIYFYVFKLDFNKNIIICKFIFIFYLFE